jgi:NADPH-dependent ferric siderophore reductase
MDNVVKRTLLGAVGDMFAMKSSVTAVRALSERFRLVTLGSQEFAARELGPAEKVQTNVGGWTLRTYTPMRLSPTELQLLLFAHGDAPGASWSREVKLGDACAFIGPRSSLRDTTFSAPFTFFGDETSFATALNAKQRQPDARFVFEVGSAAESKAVLEALGLQDAVLIEKRAGDAHRGSLQERLADAARPTVLTGNARSIQALLPGLKKLGRKVTTKPYWSPGKTGLD